MSPLTYDTESGSCQGVEGGGNGDLFNWYRLSVLQNEKLSPRENADCGGENSKAFSKENKGNQGRQL